MTAFLRDRDLSDMHRRGIPITPAMKLRTCRSRAEFDAYLANPRRDWDDECAVAAVEMQREGFPE
jgi:hypothetical protein